MLQRVLWTIVLCGLIMTGCAKKEEAKDGTTSNNLQAATAESEKLPDFTLKTLKGDEINLRQFEGQKIVVVNFWATWCGPCRREIPDFNDVYSRFSSRGVEFLGVSVDDSPKEVLPEFLQGTPITYPVLLGSPELAMRYGIQGLPTTFIVDRTGKITKRAIGMMSGEALEAELNKLL